MDEAHEWTDGVIASIEDEMLAVYGETKTDVAKQAKSMVERILKESPQFDASAVPSFMDYQEWQQVMWLVNELSQAAVDADQRAVALAQGKADEVTLHNALFITDMASAMFRLSMPMPMVTVSQEVVGTFDAKKDMEWNQRKMFSAIVQGLKDGADAVVRLVCKVLDMDMNSSKRAARTMMTRAEGFGRVQSIKAMSAFGGNVEKQWVAVMDNKTRQTHRELNGQHVPANMPFVTTSGAKLMYPADPSCGDPSEIYNCRCTIRPYMAKGK